MVSRCFAGYGSYGSFSSNTNDRGHKRSYHDSDRSSAKRSYRDSERGSDRGSYSSRQHSHRRSSISRQPDAPPPDLSAAKSNPNDTVYPQSIPFNLDKMSIVMACDVVDQFKSKCFLTKEQIQTLWYMDVTVAFEIIEEVCNTATLCTTSKQLTPSFEDICNAKAQGGSRASRPSKISSPKVDKSKVSWGSKLPGVFAEGAVKKASKRSMVPRERGETLDEGETQPPSAAVPSGDSLYSILDSVDGILRSLKPLPSDPEKIERMLNRETPVAKLSQLLATGVSNFNADSF